MENKKKSTSKRKKFLKWFLGVVLVILIALISVPFLFKDKIKAMIANSINENINATVAFKDVDLSLLKSFPQANLSISKISIINKVPFEGDTLFYADEVNLNMSIRELFKDASEAMNLKSFSVNNSSLYIVFDENGAKNFDIAKETTTNKKETEKSSFSLNIQDYTINNLTVFYTDKASKMNLKISEIVHAGKGNFDKDVLDVNTTSKAIISVDSDGTNYLNNVALSLEAIIGINLKENKFTFKENTGFINQLPLQFSGFVQLVESGQLYDINFNTPTSSFKNLLGLIPKKFAGNLKSVKTEGDFNLNGVINGTYSDKTIPNFDISLNSKNASFKYDDLPKSVKNIDINTTIINKTGNINDTYVNVNTLSFKIDEDVFSAKGNVVNIVKNPKINLQANGTINLENISKAYPIKLEKKLLGVLKANVSTSFDMNSIEKRNYQNIKNSGSMSLSNFKYEGTDVAKPFLIDKAVINFNPTKIQLTQFDAKTGTSDMSIKGNLDNFYGFLFKDEVLKGLFNLTSKFIEVSDFLSPTTVTTQNDKDIKAIKIPSFLDCNFTANVAEVRYDNLTLKNVAGTLLVKDEKIDLNKLTMNLFGGDIQLNGTVSTNNEVPTFRMNLGLDKLNIANSFTQIDMLSSIAPIANTIDGKLNATIELSGFLNKNMTPDLSKLSGNLLGQLVDSKINTENSKLLSGLNSQLNFLDVDKLNLNDLKAYIEFKDSKVTIKPFMLKHKDISFNVSGNHGFDQLMDYTIIAEVPAKYLGKEVTSYLSKLSSKDAESLKDIPVAINLSGNFKSPVIKTDLKQATTKLVNQLIEQQKDNLIDKGKNLLNDLLKKKNN